jgi:Predicted membrane protein
LIINRIYYYETGRKERGKKEKKKREEGKEKKEKEKRKEMMEKKKKRRKKGEKKKKGGSSRTVTMAGAGHGHKGNPLLAPAKRKIEEVRTTHPDQHESGHPPDPVFQGQGFILEYNRTSGKGIMDDAGTPLPFDSFTIPAHVDFYTTWFSFDYVSEEQSTNTSAITNIVPLPSVPSGKGPPNVV